MMDLSGYFTALRDRHAAHVAREAEKLAEREAVMEAVAAENARCLAGLPARPEPRE